MSEQTTIFQGTINGRECRITQNSVDRTQLLILVEGNQVIGECEAQGEYRLDELEEIAADYLTEIP